MEKGEVFSNHPLCSWEEENTVYLYFQSQWVLERSFLREWCRLVSVSPFPPIEKRVVEQRTSQLIQEGVLQPEQAQAIVCASEKSISFVSDPPLYSTFISLEAQPSLLACIVYRLHSGIITFK